jgi:hypothetical protein
MATRATAVEEINISGNSDFGRGETLEVRGGRWEVDGLVERGAQQKSSVVDGIFGGEAPMLDAGWMLFECGRANGGMLTRPRLLYVVGPFAARPHLSSHYLNTDGR